MHRLMLLIGMGTAMLAAGCAGAAPKRPIAAAAADNAVDAVRRLLADGASPDDTDESGVTPLMWAARADAVLAMEALLDAGADPNARDHRHHWTPLLHAVHKRRADAVRLLLERGADPNAVESPGQLVPLLMAAGDADPTIVELLLDYGANPRYEGEWGDTPLARALSGGALTDLIDRAPLGGCHPATVRALLARDPDLRLTGSGATRRALWFARFHGCDEALRLVRERQDSAAAGPKPPDDSESTLATDARRRQ